MFRWETSSPVTLTLPGDQTNVEGDTVSLTISASNSSSGTLKYSAVGLPSGLMINTSTGAITGTVAVGAALAAPYNVTVTASEGTYSSSQTFNWTVSSPISITDPGEQGFSEGDSVNLQIRATDSHSGTLSYTAFNLPSGLSINQSTGVVSGTISSSVAATGRVLSTVKVTDGIHSTIQSFVWNVVAPSLGLTTRFMAGEASAPEAVADVGLFIAGKNVNSSPAFYSTMWAALTTVTDNTANEKKIREEIFLKMAQSTSEKFVFRDLQAAKENVRMRVLAIDNMNRMNLKGMPNSIDFWYGPPPGQADAQYWQVGRFYDFTLKLGKNGYDAITQGMEFALWRAECGTAAQAATVLAAAQVLGAVRFNNVYGTGLRILGGLAFSSSSAMQHNWYVPGPIALSVKNAEQFTALIAMLQQMIMTEMNPQAAQIAQGALAWATNQLSNLANVILPYMADKKNWIPGDQMAYANSVFYNIVYPQGGWGIENLIYVGKDANGTPRFSGLGVYKKDIPGIRAIMKQQLEINPIAVARFKAAFGRLNNLTPAQVDKIWNDAIDQMHIATMFRVKTGD
jgi:hypothetical protein